MSFDGSAAPLRHLSASDFTADQVEGWLSQSGEPAPAEPETPTGETEWFVAYTNPKREGSVADTVRRRSFQAYVPGMEVTRRRRDVRQPLFPRYLFIGVRAPQRLYDLRETPGLEGLVRVGGELATVSAEIVGGLLSQEADGVFDFTDARLAEAAIAAAAKEAAARVKRASAIEIGASLRIVGGPWAGFGGKMHELLPPDRISVWMRMVGREWAVPMPLEHVAV